MPSELFEKKLREKLSQATIPPTPELWNNIEVQLNRGGRKRGIGIWILLGLLLLGSIGAIWGFWQMNKDNGTGLEASYAQSENLENPAPLVSQSIPDNDNKPNNTVAIKKETKGKEQISSFLTPQENLKPTINKSLNTPSSSNHRNSHYNKQTTSSDPNTYSSTVLSKDLSEDLLSHVPQHTNPTLQGSHILSETSSISSSEEIEEVAGLQLRPYLAFSDLAAKQGLSINMPKQTFRKRWAFIGYMDFHNDLRDVSFPNIAASQDIGSFNTWVDPLENNQDAYSYEGLNSPGNLIVFAPRKSLSFGIQAEWNFHPKFSLRTGLEYGSFSMGSYNVGIVGNTLSSPVPTGLNNLVSSRATIFTYHQLGIPLQLNYHVFARGHSSLNLYGGASLYAARAYSKSILQSSNFYQFADQSSERAGFVNPGLSVSNDVPSLIRYNPFNLTAQGGFDYFYHFSDKSSIFFGPQIKIQATPIYREQQAEINEVPYYLGLRLGFRFSK